MSVEVVIGVAAAVVVAQVFLTNNVRAINQSIKPDPHLHKPLGTMKWVMTTCQPSTYAQCRSNPYLLRAII